MYRRQFNHWMAMVTVLLAACPVLQAGPVDINNAHPSEGVNNVSLFADLPLTSSKMPEVIVRYADGTKAVSGKVLMETGLVPTCDKAIQSMVVKFERVDP